MPSDAESTSNDRAEVRKRFARTVLSLAEGELTFPAPFDLATSGALASNVDADELALKLAAVTAQRDTSYEVKITAVVPNGDQSLRREVIDTVVCSTELLIALLDGFLDELDARDDPTP